MSKLRIVGGNTFFTKTAVTAQTYDGRQITDFDLSLATDITVVARSNFRNIQMSEWSVSGNDLIIKWKAMPLGSYGLVVSGKYQGLEWRFHTEDVLSIVDTNAKANIPPDCIIREDFYIIDGTTLVLVPVSGAGLWVQSDWAEDNPNDPAYILNKPVMPTLATVATSGSYNDLLNKPDLQQSVYCTQAEYNAMQTHDPNVSYFIVEDE